MRKLIIQKLGGVLKAEMDSVVGVNRAQLKVSYARIEELEAENAKLRQQVAQQTGDKVIAMQFEISKLRAILKRNGMRSKVKGQWR